MINSLDALLTFENIYLIANWGVIPLWLLIMFMPTHGITKFFSHSIFVPLLLTIAYAFVGKQIYLENNIFEGFNLYLGLNSLGEIYSNESLRLIFWLHFLAISIFVGSWMARDGVKYNVSKILIIPCLLITYFAGPAGILIYWFIRIFYAKKINFDD